MAITYSRNKEVMGYIITLLFFILGIYLIFKHGKQQGFWWGVLAILLFGSYVRFKKDNFSFNLLGFLEVEGKYDDAPKNEDTPPLYEVKDGKCIKTTFLPIPDGVVYVTAPTERTEVAMCNCDKTC